MRGPPVAHRICLWQGCQTRAGRRARPPPPPRPPPGPPTCHWNRLRGDEKQLGGCARMPPKQAGTHARRVSAVGPAGAATGQGPQQLPVRQGCERTRQHLRDPGDAQTSQDSGPVSVGCRSRRPGRGPSTLAPLRGRGLAGSIGLHHGGQLVDDQLEDLDQQRDVCPALRVWEKEPDVTGSFLPLSPILLPPESDLGNTISSCLGSAGRSGAFYQGLKVTGFCP